MSWRHPAVGSIWTSALRLTIYTSFNVDIECTVLYEYIFLVKDCLMLLNRAAAISSSASHFDKLCQDSEYNSRHKSGISRSTKVFQEQANAKQTLFLICLLLHSSFFICVWQIEILCYVYTWCNTLHCYNTLFMEHVFTRTFKIKTNLTKLIYKILEQTLPFLSLNIIGELSKYGLKKFTKWLKYWEKAWMHIKWYHLLIRLLINKIL